MALLACTDPQVRAAIHRIGAQPMMMLYSLCEDAELQLGQYSPYLQLPVRKGWMPFFTPTLWHAVWRLLSVGTTSAYHQPVGQHPQIARAPPPWRIQRITPTQGHRWRRRHGTHRKPARSRGPQKTTPDTPQRAAGKEMSPSGQRRPDVSFDAIIESCMGDPHTVPTLAAPRVSPEQQRDHAKDTPLTIPRQAHLQRDYRALGHTGHATAAGDGHAAASGAADQTTDEHGAPASGARVEAGTNTANEPSGPPLGPAPPWGRGHLDYARLEGDASRPSDQEARAAAQDLGLWIPRLTAGEQLALAVRIRWLLTSRSRHLAEGTCTMADITFGHQTGHTPPATMNQPRQWHYVATRLMAHLGAYNPDEMNGLHPQWHQPAALRICATMQEHNIRDIPGSPGYQGHTSGRRRPRSQDVQEPPRQAVRRNSPEHPRHHAEWVPPLARTEAPHDRSPRGGAEAVLTLRDARQHSGTAPGDKEPWPLPPPQLHATSHGTASRLP